MLVCGLDISTSTVGYTILDHGFTIVKMSHISPNKNETFWQKLDTVISVLSNECRGIDKLYIEEPVLGFSQGMSSAHTIMTLAKFNYVIAYDLRRQLNVDPIHITAAEARKICGCKLKRKSLCGKTHKEQVAELMLATHLKDLQFPLKKSGNLKDFVYDEIDSYVIAHAAVKLNNK